MTLTKDVALVLFGFGLVACANGPRSTVGDEASAIRRGIDACISQSVVQPPSELMHAELRGEKWHVWEAGRDCEVFSTDVDAATGLAGPCSVCVT